jgi:hypothetical protein
LKSEIAYAQQSLYKEMSIYDLNANWAIMGIKRAENGDCLITFSGSIPCEVLTQSVKEFIGHLNKSIYSFMQSMLFCQSILLKS